MSRPAGRSRRSTAARAGTTRSSCALRADASCRFEQLRRGTLAADGLTVAYDNLEPITVSGTPAQVAVTTTTDDDVLEVSQDATTLEITVRSTTGSMETVTLVVPTELLEILATAKNVTIVIVGDLSLAGVTLRVVAAHITVGASVIDTTGAGAAGDIELAAGTADDAEASVELTGSTSAAATSR